MSDGKFDMIIVAARQETFEDTFLAKNCWHEISLDESKIPDLKYIGAYRTNPTSAITHFASIDRIEEYNNTGKYIVHFVAPGRRLSSEIVSGKRLKQIQNIKYTSISNILAAKTLDDL
jgi:hypothetical protein